MGAVNRAGWSPGVCPGGRGRLNVELDEVKLWAGYTHFFSVETISKIMSNAVNKDFHVHENVC